MTTVALPAFLLGHHPTKKIVCVSYSHELATKHAIDCRAVMQSDWYQRLFPMTRIGEKNTEMDFMTTQRGGRFATSVGGTLTGRGGDLFVIDDPQKPDEAMSEASRTRANAWFELTLISRLNDKQKSAIVMVMQRLHVDDVAGLVLEKGGWSHLDIPAIADEEQTFRLYSGGTQHRKVGDLLDPKREPQHVLDELKASMGTMAFSAQYLQRPVPLAGNLIKGSWFRFYDQAPRIEETDFLVISWDTAMKADQLADHSVGTIWLVRGQTSYLLDLVRDKFEFPALKRAVLSTRQRFPSANILIEDKGSGMSLIQQLRAENIGVISIKALDDKITRLYATTPMFEAGSVLFPKQAPWLDELINELLAFPNYRHDDQVDSISQALSWIRKRLSIQPSYMFIDEVY